MPVVRSQREVSQAPIPGVRKTAAETALSSGAGLAHAQANTAETIASVGGLVARIGASKYAQIQQEERDKADQIAALAMDNAFAKWEASALYDPQNGALTKQGKDALPLPEQTAEAFTKISGEIEATASTDRQRAHFQTIKLRRQQGLDLTIRRHVFGEMQAYGREELAGTLENARNEAGAAALDPEQSAAAIDRGVSALNVMAPKLGLGPEALQKQRLAFTSGAHSDIIERLLANNKDRAARVYFEELPKGQLTSDAQARVEKAIEVGSLRGESQRQADVILAAGGTLTEQRAKVKGITDPELRDAVQQRIEHEAVIRDREEREAEQSTMRSAYDILDKTANVNRIPPATWSQFDGGTRSAMRSYAEHKAKGTPVQTDLPTYYGLVQKAMDSPEAFATTNLLKYRAQLDEVEFKQLAGLQLNIVNGNKNAAEKDLGGLRTNLQIINDSLVQYGITPDGAKQTKEEADAVATLRRMLDTAVEVESQRTGKKPDNIFIQREADRILSQSVTTPGSWWNIWPGGKSVSDVTTRLIDTKAADIPPTERQQVEAALRARQQPVSDATVLDLWLRTKTRTGGQ